MQLVWILWSFACDLEPQFETGRESKSSHITLLWKKKCLCMIIYCAEFVLGKGYINCIISEIDTSLQTSNSQQKYLFLTTYENS